MHRKLDYELVPYDWEIECTLPKFRKLKVTEEIKWKRNRVIRMSHMQQCTLGDYWRPVINENYSRVRMQPTNANNVELKTSLISMV